MRKNLFLLATSAALVLAGCHHEATKTPGKPEVKAPDSPEAKIHANLEKLDPADRKLAEAQKWCAVEDENRLGDMGVPFKVMVKEQPVFLCCKSCQKRALADPERTLAKVEELKKKAAASATP